MSTITTTVTNPDLAEIRRVIAGMDAALSAGRVDEVVGSFTPDAVTFTLAPPLQNAGPAVHDASAVSSWLATFEGPVERETTDITALVDGSVGFAYGLGRLSATPKGSEEPFTLWFRVTVGLRKDQGRWAVAHRHESTPFYMDGTLRAAVDLKP